MRSRVILRFVTTVLACVTLFAARGNAETLTFQRAIELAMARSVNVGIALADQMKARSAYREARNAYFPVVVAGSGLGASRGFPLSLEGSAPSVFNFNSQSTLLNFSQREFVRAARSEWNATTHNTEDQRSQALLDTAITYAQLNAALVRIKALQEQADQARRVQFISQQRVSEGVDSKLELTRASLNLARTRMRVAEGEAAVDVLRQHLSQLTGLSLVNVDLDPESMPAIPELNPDEDAIAKALASSAAVKVADEHAKAKAQQAKGEHRGLLPSIDFAAQYALLSRFNNYEEFYNRFERHNATVGVVIRFPFLNSVQGAHAEAADAEALRAQAEAQAARNQVSSDTLKLQRSIQQLAAARDVARLEWELAQGNLETLSAKMETGSVTLREEENARIDVSDKYATYLDTAFEYDKARLQLMSATGELRDWALSRK
ncbi:MAG TPA: TolC family protein [Terriglobales bacterium]|nr:TolC family protein [Terriglobales bacterium]